MSTIRLGKGNPEVKRKKSKMSVWLFRVTTPCAFLAVWCDDRGTDRSIFQLASALTTNLVILSQNYLRNYYY